MIQQVNTARRLVASPTAKAISGLAGGNLLGMAVGFIGTLVQARYVPPSDLGLYRGFTLATGYCFMAHLGTFEALHREYPYLIGKGERERAERIAAVGQAWSIVVSVVFGGAFAILATLSFERGDWRSCLGWLAQSVAAVGLFYSGYLTATYRTGHDFQRLSKTSVITNGISLAALPLLLVSPYLGLVIRSIISSASGTIYLHRHRPLRLGWHFDFAQLLGLAKRGMPIFGAGYIWSPFWSIVEASIVLRSFGVSALGLWSMSTAVVEAASLVPQAFNQVYMPRIAERYGRTNSVVSCLSLGRVPCILSTAGVMVIAGFAFLTLPIVVPKLMPKYVQAVPVMSVMLLYLPIAAMRMPYYVLVSAGRRRDQYLVALSGVTSFVALAILAVNLGLGMCGLVACSVFGRAVGIVVMYVLLNRLARGDTTAS